MEQVNIDSLSVNDLKVMAYDTLGRIEVEQRNLQLINQKITEKSQLKEGKVEEKKQEEMLTEPVTNPTEA